MKRLIALLLVLLTAAAIFAGCTTKPEPTQPDKGSQTTSEVLTDESQKTSDDQPTVPDVDPEKVSDTFDVNQLFTIATTDGKQLEWKDMAIKEHKNWEGTVWRFENQTLANGEVICGIFAGDKMKTALTATTLLPDEKLELGNATSNNINKKQGWYVKKTDNDTYRLVSAGNPRFAVGYEKKEFVLKEQADAAEFVLTPVKNENAGTLYTEYVSDKGNITVRLPVDVVDQVYGRVKSDYPSESEDSLKQRIGERMAMFANSSQKTYDALVELTGFVPYNHIFIHAFEHQGVMAGVVGNDNNIYVNVDWYVDDMEKMWRRWEVGKEDFNFCTLHEMGHMFDWNRGWNFESEMETDFKASYVLYKYRNDEFGAWAAPAEYSWSRVFDINTIDTQGYSGLSSNMVYGVKDGEVKYSYSIYRSAQMYVSYVKYCEETAGYKGFEAMKEAFHWFQDNNKTQGSYPSGKERFEALNEKLSEFTGLDINEYMLKISKFRRDDWEATAANAAGLPGKI